MLGRGKNTSLILLWISSSHHSLYPFKVDLYTSFIVFSCYYMEPPMMWWQGVGVREAGQSSLGLSHSLSLCFWDVTFASASSPLGETEGLEWVGAGNFSSSRLLRL